VAEKIKDAKLDILENESTPALTAPPEACFPDEGRGLSFVSSTNQSNSDPGLRRMTGLGYSYERSFSFALDCG